MSSLTKAKSTEAADRIVCHCYGVTESAIRDTIASLDSDGPEVGDVTRRCLAGGGCNACHFRIRRLPAGKPLPFGGSDVCADCGSIFCDCAAS